MLSLEISSSEESKHQRNEMRAPFFSSSSLGKSRLFCSGDENDVDVYNKSNSIEKSVNITDGGRRKAF